MAAKHSRFTETVLVQRMKQRNKIVRALRNGAGILLNGGRDANDQCEPSIADYIPKEEKESKQAYANRLKRVAVTPYVDDAVNHAAGQLFKTPVQLTADGGGSLQIPDELSPILEDIDRQGHDLNEFLMLCKKESLSYGMQIVFVDFHNPSESDDLAQQKATGARPYVKQISYNDLLGYTFDDSGNVTMLRYREQSYVTDEFLGSDKIDQVRVLRPDSWEIWRRGEKNEDVLHSTGQIRRFNNGGSNQNSIPIAVMYDRKIATLDSASVFESLAYLNLRHCQLDSDVAWSSHFYLIPFLVAIWGNDNPPDQSGMETLGSYVAVDMPANSEVKWIETNGNAHKAALEQLEAIENRMSTAKMDSTVSSGAKETATGRAIEADSASAQLRTFAESIEGFTRDIISLLQSYMPTLVMPAYEVEANKDFDLQFSNLTIKDLGELVEKKLISHDTFLQECKRRSFLPDNLDNAKEISKIEDETANGAV